LEIYLAKAAGSKYKSCDTQRQILLANIREKFSLVFTGKCRRDRNGSTVTYIVTEVRKLA